MPPEFLVYRITNTTNGKIYVGAHKGHRDDAYMGSGRILRRAIKKYGVEAFAKEILFTCASEIEMYEKERELVTEDFVRSENTYNMILGGHGGFSHCEEYKFRKGVSGGWTGRNHSEETKRYLASREISSETREKMSVAGKHRVGDLNGFYGHQHSPESRAKMSAAAKGHKRGVGRKISEATREKMRQSAILRARKRKETT